MKIGATDKNDNAPPLTRGEKIFNAIDYWGIGWITNAAISVAITDWMNHLSGQTTMNQWADKLKNTVIFRKGEMKTAEEIGKARGQARSVLSLLFLMSGGFILMAPIKWLEDRKKPTVEWLDDRFNKPRNKEEEAQIKARHDYIEKHEPKQSWESILKGRVYALVPILGAHFMLNKPYSAGTKQINRLLGTRWKGIDQSSANAAEALHRLSRTHLPETVKATEESLGAATREAEAIANRAAAPTKNPLPFEQVDGKTRFQNIIDFSIQDIFYSLVAASMTFLFSKSIAAGKANTTAPAATYHHSDDKAPESQLTLDPTVHASKFATLPDTDCPKTTIRDAEKVERQADEPEMERVST